MNELIPWNASAITIVPDSVSDPGIIAEKALQLRPRERSQIAKPSHFMSSRNLPAIARSL